MTCRFSSLFVISKPDGASGFGGTDRRYLQILVLRLLENVNQVLVKTQGAGEFFGPGPGRAGRKQAAGGQSGASPAKAATPTHCARAILTNIPASRAIVPQAFEMDSGFV
jgi:hypothetical protein